MDGRLMEWSSIILAMEGITGQNYLPARTSSRSPILALFLARPVGRLVGKATTLHSCSRQLMEEKPGHQFPFHFRIASMRATQVESNQRWHCSVISCSLRCLSSANALRYQAACANE